MVQSHPYGMVESLVLTRIYRRARSLQGGVDLTREFIRARWMVAQITDHLAKAAWKAPARDPT